jgi:hypothetical protein
MKITRRAFTAGSLALGATAPGATGSHDVSSFLEFKELPQNYVERMISVITAIHEYPRDFAKLVQSATENPSEDSAYKILNQSMRNATDLIFLSGTDWRDRYLLIHEKKCVVTLKELTINQDFLLNDDALIQLFHRQISEAEAQIKKFLPLADMENETGLDLAEYLEKTTIGITNFIDREKRLLAEFEERCLQRYGLPIHNMIIDPKIFANIIREYWGDYGDAISGFSSIVTNPSLTPYKFLGPHTRVVKKHVIEKIITQLLRDFAANSPQEYQAFIASHEQASHATRSSFFKTLKAAFSALAKPYSQNNLRPQRIFIAAEHHSPLKLAPVIEAQTGEGRPSQTKELSPPDLDINLTQVNFSEPSHPVTDAPPAQHTWVPDR